MSLRQIPVVSDRFMTLDVTCDRSAFIAFADGPPVCIGAHFSLLEAPLVLASMLERANSALLDSAPIAPEASGSLRPVGGVPARVHLRVGDALRESRALWGDTC